MLISYHRGQGSVVLRLKILDSSVSTGAGKTGLTNASSGLIISTIADNEATATAYTAAGSTIDTITTLGTYAAPTAGHCRFKEVDSTNHKGVYEIQIADARFAVTSAKSLLVSISGAASNIAETDATIPLTDADPYNAITGGHTALPATACTTNGSLLTSGSGTDQVSVSAGKVLLQATQTGVTIPTVTTVTNQLTAAQIATGVWQDTTAGDFTVASSIGKSLYTTGAVPGAAGGLFIAGSNAATTVNFTGNLSGSVGSVTGNVGGNVVGSVGSISGVTFPSGFSTLTTATIAAAAWDLATTGHTTAGTFGASMVAAGSAGDPWATSLPGAYGAGTAGNIVGNRLDAAVSSRSTYAGGAVASVTGNVGGNVVGSVGSISGVSFPANFGVMAIAATTGQVGIDWSNVKAPTTAVNLSGTTISTSQAVASVSGSVGSVTGAVGSVTGNVGGNVVGSVASVTGTVTANLAATGLDSVVIETGVTAKQALAAIGAATAGQSSGVAAGSPVFKAMGNPGTTRISATATNGDRSTVTLTLP